MAGEGWSHEGRLLRRELLRRGSAAASLAGLSLLLPAVVRATEGPAVRIIQAPRAGAGPESQGEIQGEVSGAGKDFSQLRVVIYALSDKWYVQPVVEAPLTSLNASGRWRATIHLGTRYAALLVRPGYRPPSTTMALPE